MEERTIIIYGEHKYERQVNPGIVCTDCAFFVPPTEPTPYGIGECELVYLDRSGATTPPDYECSVYDPETETLTEYIFKKIED